MNIEVKPLEAATISMLLSREHARLSAKLRRTTEEWHREIISGNIKQLEEIGAILRPVTDELINQLHHQTA